MNITDFISEMSLNKGLSMKEISEIIPELYPEYQIKDVSKNHVRFSGKNKSITVKIEKNER